MYADYSVELGHDDPALELPWRAEHGTCCYQDLKSDPSLIDSVPEAVQYPELRRLLLRLNASNFPLQTAKCDVWITQELAPEEDIFNADWKQGAYVDLLFVREDKRLDLRLHQILAESLCTLLARAPEFSASVELVIRRCHYWNAPFSTIACNATPLEPIPLEPIPSNPIPSEPALSKTTLSAITAFNAQLPAEQTPFAELTNPGQAIATHIGCAPAATKTSTPSGIGCPGPESMAGSGTEIARDTTAGFYFTLYVNGFGTTQADARRQWAIASELVTNALVQVADASQV